MECGKFHCMVYNACLELRYGFGQDSTKKGPIDGLTAGFSSAENETKWHDAALNR